MFKYVLVVFLFSYSSHAATLTFYGHLFKCQGWIENNNKVQSEQQALLKNMIISDSKTWLAGYMTAFNELTQMNPKYSVQIDTLYDYVNLYCIKNKSDYLSDAVLSMTKKLAEVDRSGKKLR